MTTERGGAPGGGHTIQRPWYGLDDSWMEAAACKGLKPDEQAIFFVNSSRRLADRLAETEAKAICLGCDVRKECLEYAIAGEMYGIWGGATWDERRRLIRKRRTANLVATVPPNHHPRNPEG